MCRLRARRAHANHVTYTNVMWSTVCARVPGHIVDVYELAVATTAASAAAAAAAAVAIACGAPVSCAHIQIFEC